MSANARLTTAVHALCWLELARRRGWAKLSSAQVAASLASHPVLVRTTLAPLRKAGLVESGRGRGAGWALSRPADTITVADVHRALAAEPAFALHPHEPNLDCPVGFGIRPVLTELYAEVDAAVVRSLGTRTIAGLLDQILSRSEATR
jgi:DNA-binding IscR family transcriptional regulator